jgi:hypothetical protein
MPVGPRQLRRFQVRSAQLDFRRAALGKAAADLSSPGGSGGLLSRWGWPDRPLAQRRSARCRSAARMADGLVVQGVLLTVLVTAIGLLAIASRVASSREGAAAGSLAAAARQAAEYGFTEIVAEMNRDSKSYLWVTPFASWNSVSDADLRACGIYASVAPGANPIEGASNSATASKVLPDSSTHTLSYSFDFELQDLSSANPSRPNLSPPCQSGTVTFGNSKGGTATLTIVGTARRGGGNTTTYTLKRTVSVRRAADPVSRRSIFTTPATSDPRFPPFPTAQTLGVSVTSGSSRPNMTCLLATPDSAGGSKYTCNAENFDNSLFKFPYRSSGALATGCSPNPANTQIVCQFSSLFLEGTTSPSVGVQMVVDVSTKPVNIFINDPSNSPVTIRPNANLCSDSSGSTAVTTCSGTGAAAPIGNWKRLRLFGKAPGAACDQQQISLQNTTSINLLNAFLWFPSGRFQYTSQPTLPSGLVGVICDIQPLSNTVTSVATIAPNEVTVGLAEIFPIGATSPPIRFVYRGYGSQEQQP